MSREVRVRFAPSPTGPLHIGGVRTALYNYLFAKKNKGHFILRIEDTDQNRYVKGAEEYIREALHWAGIHPDEGPDASGPFGPYRQSERKEHYEEYAERMIAEGTAYYAFDTPEDLEEMRDRMSKAGVPNPKYDHVSREYMKNSLTLPADEVKARLSNNDPYVIRIKVPRKEEVRLKDMIRGWVVVQSGQLDDKVLFKSDGMPTYHLANIVDDHLMKITHVIRGEEWLPSAPLHVLLYRYLGWEETMPEFAHLPLILKPDGKGKLSKRDGAKGGYPVFPLNWKDPESGETFTGYRESGYFPEAMVNILAMLGWNPGDNREVFSIDELIDTFSIEKVSKSGAKFDPEKARWYNQQHLRHKDDMELAHSFRPILREQGVDPEMEYIAAACALIKEKASFINEFWEMGSFFFKAPEEYDQKVIEKKWNAEALKFFVRLKENLYNLSHFTAEDIENTYKSTADNMGVKGGQYMQLFRVLVSGLSYGPAIFEMISLLGQKEIVQRLDAAIEQLQ
ncbi:MAG: glutamate--tRNA ligase [Bacteroidia bacterium]